MTIGYGGSRIALSPAVTGTVRGGAAADVNMLRKGYDVNLEQIAELYAPTLPVGYDNEDATEVASVLVECLGQLDVAGGYSREAVTQAVAERIERLRSEFADCRGGLERLKEGLVQLTFASKARGHSLTLYKLGHEYVCHECALVGAGPGAYVVLPTPADAQLHCAAHVKAGDVVPGGAMLAIDQEVTR